MDQDPPFIERRSSPRFGQAHTKIVATLGPATDGGVSRLLDAGMSVARINFSHGEADDHRRRVDELREAARERGVRVGVLADIRGPKLRMGTFPDRTLTVEEGEGLHLVEGPGPAGPGEVPLNFPDVCDALTVRQRVFLADGAVELVVEEPGSRPLARVVRGGLLSDHKGVHLPGADLHLEVPTEQDRADLELAKELDVDFVGVSFVSRAFQVRAVRRLVPDTLIVAKIERAEALDHLEEILEASDGIMVARGDLGVEVEPERLPLVQKSLIQEAAGAGRFVITATEMLESMITSSRPTRAEVADVANAVLDGTDALMLSAETAVGHHPVEAVRTMERIARTIETSPRYQDLPKIAFRDAEPTFSNAVALAAVQAAGALGIRKIICFTETGNTVRLLSRYRPRAEVVALSPHEDTLGQVTVLAHVRPLPFPHRATLEEMLDQASSELREKGLVLVGEEVVFVAGVPPGVARSTNVLKLHRIGDPIKLG